MAARRNLARIAARARLEGFRVVDFASRYGEAIDHLGALDKDGKHVVREHLVEGIEHFNSA